ncbi:PE family protein [Mycobacterium sp.]|jgi:hypothetical protein|uniref:PE family protein n=1 Tax=Mycobacterium sp. TaxID=1785 RepID=UPI002D473F65|nr:PE family protein [Mycobacterium sp.]HZA10650.1 PE family protein [Mycobacterium sp.]
MTLPILVDPALLGVSAGVEHAGTATMAAASGVATPVISTVLPAGADAVSIGAAEALNARGAATAGALTEFVAMREMFADTLGLSGVSYALREALNTIAVTV